ncbi:MAG: hypothetical protein WDM88_00325 [Galbitalea sp.]
MPIGTLMKNTSRQPKSGPPSPIENTAHDRTERRGDADRDAEAAERAAPLAARKRVLDVSGDLRAEQPAEQALDDTGRDHHERHG